MPEALRHPETGYLQDALRELRIARHRGSLVQGTDDLHLLRREFEIEYIGIRTYALAMYALRNDHDSALELMAQRDLTCAFSMTFSYFHKFRL